MIRFWKALNDIYGWIVTASFVLILLIGVWQIYDNYYVFSHTIDNSVLRYKPGASDISDGGQAPFSDDLVGWLTIDGTDIDYPVMQGSDNAEYLSKDPYGGYSATGSIFLDSRSSPDFTDSFSIIYGHHMDYGRLFGALDDFLDELRYMFTTGLDSVNFTANVDGNSYGIYSFDRHYQNLDYVRRKNENVRIL